MTPYGIRNRAYDNLAIHLVKESMVMSKNSSSNAKLMHGFKLLLAKQYIDNLSEEVIKGQNEKAAEGIYPSKAPVGYRNVDDGHGKRIIVVDPKQAPFVRKAFELYATGLYSANTINNMLYKEGFRTDKAINSQNVHLKECSRIFSISGNLNIVVTYVKMHSMKH